MYLPGTRSAQLWLWRRRRTSFEVHPLAIAFSGIKCDGSSVWVTRPSPFGKGRASKTHGAWYQNDRVPPPR
jgi:hypothetical protein